MDTDVNGRLRVRTGGESDIIEIKGNAGGPCVFHGRFDMRTEAGEDEVKIFSSNFGGAFLLDMGDDNDRIEIERNTLRPSWFEGPTIVRLGAGDDIFQMGLSGSPIGEAYFYDTLLIDGGPGADTADVGWIAGHNNGNEYALPPTFSNTTHTT